MKTSDRLKIIISGPVNSGKTTFIGTLSDIDPVTTDVQPSDEVARVKKSTTVAMDYGMVRIGEGVVVDLYGTPGQTRFSFMCDILMEGALGLILLVNNTEEAPVERLRDYLQLFQKHRESVPLCVGVTHMDRAGYGTLAEYRRMVANEGWNSPVFSVDARSEQDANILLTALMGCLDPTLIVHHITEYASRYAELR